MGNLKRCEAETIGQTQAIKEAIWLRRLLQEIDPTDLIHPTNIFADNQGAIALAKNPQFHSRTKHFDIQTHFVRQQLEENIINLQYVPTEKQVADGMTKPLPEPAFIRFRSAIGVYNILPVSEETVGASRVPPATTMGV